MQGSDQQRIGERYELRQSIGIGGMARVYLAHDRLLNREVAVKILSPALAADPLFVERFRREAQAAAALNHPNIVTIYDTGATDDTYYIVMEYVPGPNLKERIRERGPLAEHDALVIGAQVAAALGAAHAHHLIHRDIKPHNVLLTPVGSAKVTDFGIARAAGASQLTATQTVMGSAHYLSPEQALHQPLDGRSDLYSLGVVLYEALTGRVPFDGDSLVAVAMRQVHDPPPSMRHINANISPRAESVVMRAMAKDPAARYQSAAEMEAALVAASRVSDPPASTRRRARPSVAVTSALPASPPPGVVESPRVDERPAYVSAPAPTGGRGRRWLIVPLLALLGMVIAVAGVFALRSAGSGHAATVAPTTAARASTTPQASVVVAAAPSITPPVVATETPAPQPTTVIAPTVIIAPTVAAPPTAAPIAQAPTVPAASPTPLATPTATPQPVPTATPVPATEPPPASPTAPAPTPPSRPVVAGGAATPAQAVEQFYQAVSQHQFDAAAQLWSPRMKTQFNTQVDINGHFAPTQRIDYTIGNVVTTGDGRATVAVQLTDVRAGGSLRYVGSWQVVRGPSGWLLDQPNLQSV